MKVRLIFAAFAVAAILAIFGGDLISPVMAQVDTGLNAIGQTIALPDTDPRVIVARLINVFLGLLGIIFLVLILYAGFLWMTAGGDSSKVDKAKKYLINSIIGLIIVLSSWAIASFIINSLINAATSGGGAGGGGAGGGGAGGGGFGPGGGDAFRIMAKSPQGTVGNADLIIRVLFNKNVDDTTLGAFLLSPSANGAWTVDPANPKRVIFTPSDPCPGVPQKSCFPFNTVYTVTVGTNLRSTANEQLRCGGFYPDCTFDFTSGDTVDTQAPGVNILSLFDGMSVPVDTAVEVSARATDDIGISNMEFTEGGQSFHSDGPSATPSPKVYETSGYWDTVGKALQQIYTIQATADDLDTNKGSASVDVIVLAQHCFDTVQNLDETDVDCGGADCLACSGGACTSNSQCASGLCVNGFCVEQPIITDVKPISGKEGTYVSIWGKNFGDAGTVAFLGPPEVSALAPQLCMGLGTKTWTDHFVLVEVPVGAATGPLRLINGNSNLEDRTDDTRGPLFTFEVTNEEKPGLCGVSPDAGKPGDSATAQGSGLGSTAGQLGFGNFVVSTNSWTNSAASFLAPVVTPGTYPVFVQHQNGAQSNKVPYTVQTAGAAQAAPVITYVDPANGPRGAYISIVGQRFGNTPGIVKFVERATGDEYNGDSAFPNGCDIGWWRDNLITIKAPSVNASVPVNSDFDLYIIRNDQERSNEVGFVYSDGDAGPGICTINPTAGPVDALVKLFGERLGNSGGGNQVVFANNLPGTVVSWQTDQIEVRVPNQAVTGDVFARVGGKDSNKMQFAVANCQTTPGICGANQICCPNGTCSSGACAQVSFAAMYAWQLSTGVIPHAPSVIEYCDASGQSTQLPSPTPWLNYKGGDQVCVNPAPRFGVLFDMPIQWPVSSPKSLFQLKKCIGTGADPCDELADVAITTPTILANQQPQVPYVSFEPVSPLSTSTYYYVFISRDVRSADLEFGTIMDEKTDCPIEGLGYCYRFRTRNDDAACEVGDVYLLPWETYLQGGESQAFEALPVTKNAVCNLMNCDNFDFNWSTDPDSKAWLENPSSKLCKQNVIAGSQEAMNPPVKVRAEEDVSKLFGLADLYIRFINPRIIDRFPECDEACSNIAAWAQFNTSLWSDAGATVQNSVIIKDTTGHYKNVKMFRCKNENCFKDEYAEEVDITVELLKDSLIPSYQNKPAYNYSFMRIDPVLDLAAGTYYTVWINGGPDGITSRYGMRMDQPVQWRFRTRLEGAACKPERVDVVPRSVIEDRIGDRELFNAAVFTKPDTCHEMGQLLKQKSSFAWQFPDVNQHVAKKMLGDIDLGGTLPHGCTNQCKAAGSDGVFGAIAVCGNNVIETSDPNYCNGGVTPANQPCVLLPMESGAGEQCDDGVGGLCDDQTCLFKPVPGGNCGDGIIQYSAGEMCDPGYRCWGVLDPALEGALCTGQVATDCVDAGGACGAYDYRGCSSGCKHLGASSVENTVCGNGGTPGAGEDCDLGPDNGKGGCSQNCLHTGSSALVMSVCGNGVTEPGETCDGIPLPATCDAQRCVNRGLPACSQITDPNCCGNATIDAGEDCDDGNHVGGDGCGANCLLEGSNWQYTNPSFCGNGILETGEVCESGLSTEISPKLPGIVGTGDLIIDPLQLAIIEPGDGTPDANNVIKTALQCTYEGINGEAEYGVQCGKTQESECGPGFGLDNHGCCSRRPALSYQFPQGDNGGQGWCRNVLIEAHFGVSGGDPIPMDRSSVSANFVIAEEVLGVTDCPAGTSRLVMAQPIDPGLWNWAVSKWHAFIAWLKGEPAYAVYCTQTVSGQLVPKNVTTTTDFVYRLNTALKANTNYIVRFAGDADAATASDDNIKQGIKTAKGVVAIADTGDDPNANPAWNLTWWFETGADICRVNQVIVQDTTTTHPGFFNKAYEEHLFNATAASIQNGQPQPISPTNDYDWQWQAWAVNDPTIATNNDNPATIGVNGLAYSESAIRVSTKSGYASVFARIKIMVDNLTPGLGSTVDKLVEGMLPITVFICDNPWPRPEGELFAPFRDADQSVVTNHAELWLKDFYADLYSDPNRKFFNFQTMYCRDHANGLMPTLHPHLLPITLAEEVDGILRQYLFTYQVPAYQSDGIGIRVYKNLYHLTPLQWYRSQGFVGNPQSLKIDGYDAVRDGATTYIAFPNTEGLMSNIYHNILVISHNVGASPITQEIYQQLLDNLAFNINFDFDNANVCVAGGQAGVSAGEIYLDPTTKQPIYCTSDWQCLTVDNQPGPKLRCASFKYKLRHDIQRLNDFIDISNVLEQYYDAYGKYPDLKSGTFQSGETNSRWPSWQETLGSALGVTLPVDPVNRFAACGYCKPKENPAAQSTIPCVADEDCPGDTWFCESKQGFDSRTCWNVDERKFMCPYMDEQGNAPATQYDPFGADEPYAPSRFYKYRVFDNGRRFELGANFEVPPMSFGLTGAGEFQTQQWWYLPYVMEVRKCRTDSPLSNGRMCLSNFDCKSCVDPFDPACTEPIPPNSCVPTGKRWLFKNICNNQIFGSSATCGDGVIGQYCSANSANAGDACTVDADCAGGGTCLQEVCEQGDTKLLSCDYSAPNDGFKLAVCQDCKQFADDPTLSQCRPKVMCGNGRIDGTCGGGQTDPPCTSDADCTDQTVAQCTLLETCDDGVMNGTYGNCNLTCSGYDKYCGDNKLNPGEDCDLGAQNGQWCENINACYGAGSVTYANSCGFGCTGKAPFCGDGKKNGPEQCDGNVLTTAQAICNSGQNKGQPCSTHEECYIEKPLNIPVHTYLNSCGVGAFNQHPSYRSCQNITIKRCATGASICATPNIISAMENGTLFTAFPNYKNLTCKFDTDCNTAAGEKCTSLSQATNCTTDDQCSISNQNGVCSPYQTEHVRSCNDPGTPDQCKYQDWTDCKIAHSCGDGVIDPGEECDDGIKNAYHLACLPTCKKNICGDGYPQENVEECDKGADNGKSLCMAQYGSTCNDCSTACKIMAKAGGYCGNEIKDAGEQCDGNIKITQKTFAPPENYILPTSIIATDADAQTAKSYIGATCEKEPCLIMKGTGLFQTTLTCKQLGFDFAINDTLHRAIEITDKTRAQNYRISQESLQVYVSNNLTKIAEDDFQNKLLLRIFIACGLMDTETVNVCLAGTPPTCVWGDILKPYFKPQSEWPAKMDFWRCVNTQGLLNGFKMYGEPNIKPACGLDCKPTGCGRCSEEPGNGTIHGYVLDRLWLQAVPGARVTLQYRGVNVDQVLTDENGRFEFKNLSARSECDQYRLVIDKYDDNVCTSLKANRPESGCLPDITADFDRAVDEGKNGGYWPFTTEEFSIQSYPWQEMLGMIYIYPRPAKGEGYVAYGRPTLFDRAAWEKVQECQQNNDTGCLWNNIRFNLPWFRQWAPHIIWPASKAYQDPWMKSGVGTYSASNAFQPCLYADRGTTSQNATGNICTRDVNWVAQGNLDFGSPPYSAMLCPLLAWDRDGSKCPFVGTDACVANCLSHSAEWRLINDWTGIKAPPLFCQSYCNPTGSCPATPTPDNILSIVQRCHLDIHNAQATGYFRYKGQGIAEPNLTEPIEIYFTGPDYNPFAGESIFTVGQASIPKGVLSWRNYWAKTAIKIYVSTDKGIYSFVSDDAPQSKLDFQKPFWHLASILPDGQVTVQNKWQSTADVSLPKAGIDYPDSQTSIQRHQDSSTRRPAGMACWNWYGARCEVDSNRKPILNICKEKGKPGTIGIVTFLPFYSPYWNPPFVNTCLSALNIESAQTNTENYNQVNW